MSDGRGWHRHYRVRCTKCGEIMWPRVTCASRRGARACLIRKIVVCQACRRAE